MSEDAKTVEQDAPPCDCCGDPHFEVCGIITPFHDEDDQQITILVSLCSLCTQHDALVRLAARNALTATGVYVPPDDPKEAN